MNDFAKNEERVSRFNKEIGAGYICKAKKPSPKNYIRAMEPNKSPRTPRPYNSSYGISHADSTASSG